MHQPDVPIIRDALCGTVATIAKETAELPVTQQKGEMQVWPMA